MNGLGRNGTGMLTQNVGAAMHDDLANAKD